MTILKQEVRTITTIGLRAMDLGEVIKAYKENEANQIFYPHAFRFMNTEDTTLGNLRSTLENLQFKANADTFGMIARYYGYDGWANAGHYNKGSNHYSMTVYSYGDNIN